jgi:hypothetical protein
MKVFRLMTPLAAAALAACGSAATTAVTAQDFRAAAPTSGMLAISQNDGDSPEGNDASDASASAQALTTPECHPHLFVRTHEIIGRVNRHFAKLLHHVDDLIEDNPLTDGETKTWENVRSGVDRKLTITRTANADGSVTFDFELDLASVPATGSPSFVKVLWGSITHIGPAAEDKDAGAGQLVENKGTVTFDFTALASVKTSERARGQITDTFDNVHDPDKGVKRTATIVLTEFIPEEGDLHGPRSGTYSWEREPSVGGKLKFEDTVTLFCLSNPAGLQSDLTTVSRWYKADGGQVRGRSDAKATGGQLPTGDVWMGVTCAKGQTTSAPAEGFWLMKLEDSTGATVGSFARSAQVGVDPCDPLLAKNVPNPTDSSTDFDFSVAFTDITFPNEW